MSSLEAVSIGNRLESGYIVGRLRVIRKKKPIKIAEVFWKTVYNLQLQLIAKELESGTLCALIYRSGGYRSMVTRQSNKQVNFLYAIRTLPQILFFLI